MIRYHPNKSALGVIILAYSLTYVVLLLGNLRTLIAVLGKWVSEFYGSGLGCEFLQELVINLLMDEYSRSGATSLSMIPTTPISTLKYEGKKNLLYAKRSPVHRLIEISIIINDIRALPTQLQRNIFQIALGSSLHDLSSNDRATSKSDLLDIHV